jgi:hypothetical protein
MLPPPAVLHEYTSDERAAIIRWNDARVCDESRRQDRLVDAEVEMARKGSARSYIVVVSALAIGAAVALITRDPLLAGVFLSMPLFVYATQIIVHTAVGRRRTGDTDDV